MKNLLGRLMSRPFDELKVISASWGALTRDPNPSQNDLAIAVYHAMVDPSAARGVWESLDPEMRAFVVWLLEQRNMLALYDDLPGYLDRPPEDVASLLERIRNIGLIDVDEALVRGTRVVSSGDNLYAWGARNQTEAVRRKVVSLSAEAGKVLTAIIEESKRPAPFEDSFTTLMQALDQEQVQRIAATWKLPEAARYYKSELIGVMNEFLATGQGRQLLLSALPPASQKAFEFIESEGGKTRAVQVRTHFEWDVRDFRAAFIPLIQRALVWDVIEGEARYLFIPTDLMAGRRSQNAQIAPANLPKLDAPAPYNAEGRLPYEMTWDLLTLLSSASDADILLTLQDSRITKRLAKRINDSFLHPDDLKTDTAYIDMLVHLAQTLGLLTEKSGEQPALALSPKADEWASLSFNAQRRRLFGLWQEDRKWAEPATYGTIYWWNSDLTDGRKRLVQHLLDLPVGDWIQLEAFLRKIHLVEPFIIWSQDELVRRFGLRALQGFRNQWFNIEGRIVADMLKTMLLWLGVVELGRDKQKRLISFRVTEEGRALIDSRYTAERPVPAKTLMVQPNFEVLVLHPESQVLWNLMRSADLVRHDRVSAYTINKESIARGSESGLSAAQIKEFLDANTGKGLPQNVAHSIEDWSRLVKRATIKRVTVIEVADEAVLDEMLASRKTRKMVAQRLSPTVAVLNLPEVTESSREDPWQKLLKDLKAVGFSVRMIGDEIAGTPIPDPSSAAAHTNGAEKKPAARRTAVSRLRSGTRDKGLGTGPSTNGKTGTEQA